MPSDNRIPRAGLSPYPYERIFRMIRKLLLGILIVILFPFYSVLFISIHELGHVAVMRLLGDGDAWFYLIRVDGNERCLGCTTSGPEEVSWGGDVAIRLGGLIATQTVAITALLLLSLCPRRKWMVTALSIVALTFAFFDILAQVPQGLYYNLDNMTADTGVDLAGLMLLIQMKIDAGQVLLKGILLAAAILYLFGFVWLYRRCRRAMEVAAPSQSLVQEGIQISPGD
jgi:hypothetical protein